MVRVGHFDGVLGHDGAGLQAGVVNQHLARGGRGLGGYFGEHTENLTRHLKED